MEENLSQFSDSANKILDKVLSEKTGLDLRFGDSALVAESLSRQGELCLLNADLQGGLQFFDQALKLDPENASLYLNQGLSLYEYGRNEGKEKALLIASKKFKMATVLSSDLFEAWHIWGASLSFLGKTYKEHHYFIEAEEKLRKAISYSESIPLDTLGELYWDYANVLASLAEHSKEALDWQMSIDSFQKASSYQEQLPADFWIDYGTSCQKLSSYINDIRLCIKAIHCFKHALSQNANAGHEGWKRLSHSLHYLYSYTHDEDHFTQANECFSAAAQLRPNEADLWHSWARFLLESGRNTQDSKKLRVALEKCQRAHECDSGNATILATWGETIALLGQMTERLDLLYEGQNKITEAQAIGEDNPYVWYSLGQCLNSFGNYFCDFDYHYQAIEKLQQGLSLDRTLHTHWHAIGMSYFFVGQLETDPDAIEKGLRFFTKALELQPNNSYYHFDYSNALSRMGEFRQDQSWLEMAVTEFERTLALQKNAIYIHPEWLFQYARSLDLLGDFYEEESYYTRALEILSQVLMVDPDFLGIHHQIALCFSHLGELNGELDNFYKALHYFRLASKHEEENDQVMLDLGLTLVNISQHTLDSAEAEACFRDAETKLTQAAKGGHLQAYYHLACLYSLLAQHEKAMHFILKADDFASLPSLEELLQDEWLESLRATSEFREFLLQLENRPNLQEEC